ncbi:MAG: 16S rRNA (cytosine(1402)-N(4))-methyltransferase RsmH [Spirochaetales bacterium]|nr:16S rRNA (cytosine(1402)-N(4))-methyltransferase RsmH [Spirochaetales bacterium]
MYVHTPVMLKYVLDNVVSNTDKMFLDCTLGEGGHTEAVLRTYPEIRVCGLDRDAEILEVARNRMRPFADRFIGFQMNFAEADSLKEKSLLFDSALIDLGISVFHYKISGRGFSFSREEPLDMRLDSDGESVADLVNNLPENELRNVLYKYAEERFAPMIAKKIADYRKKQSITLSTQLAEIVTSAIPAKFRGAKIHPATKTFQALRIAVNHELDYIEPGIRAVLSLLKKGGRLGVITFHSLEDKIVKNLFKYMSLECVCPPKIPKCVCTKVKEVEIIGKSLTADDDELRDNPPSRSARLRIVEKV